MRAPALLFLVALVAYGAVAGKRLLRGSADPHFVVQADAWLHGRADIEAWPAGADDPAKVEEVRVDDGTVVRGRRLKARPAFRIVGGREIPAARIAQSLRTLHYVSFPPFPSVLFLPQAAISGARANDVATTVVLAALVPAAFLLCLRRLRAGGLTDRTPRDEVWLALLLGFGTVFFFSAVQGRVWFTAHVVGVLLSVLYVWASVEAERPLLAGACLGLATATRTPMLFLAPLFLYETWRVGGTRRDFLRRLVLFAAPLAAIGALCAWYNYARFGELAEFGHSYLEVRQQAQIERFGLFSSAYLGRNLAVALTLLPQFSSTPPFVSISGHGLAMWVTTPILVYLLWPARKAEWHRILWLCVAVVAGWSLFYQNSGWVQFGYRFSLDYITVLVVLLAVGGRRLGHWAKVLIVAGIAVNLFGAITFNRIGQVYRTDNAAYDCVVPH
ncbi:MAG TPA: hypothetical protein VKE22_08905 [Haliangiales bacterium]|nr:hypothetical protein [Haliangiales bacterium]